MPRLVCGRGLAESDGRLVGVTWPGETLLGGRLLRDARAREPEAASPLFLFVALFFLGREVGLGGSPCAGFVAAGRGHMATTSLRQELPGARTPLKRCRGKRGGGLIETSRARKTTGVMTRCVAPFLLGFFSR